MIGDRRAPEMGGGGGGDPEPVSGWWIREINADSSCRTAMEVEYARRHHLHEPLENQCSSILVKHIKAPIHLVWSLVRRFDQPQKYKPFVSRCVVEGAPTIGSVREVNVKSGLPATTSKERLELLDDNEHVLRMKIVGGDHRLKRQSLGLETKSMRSTDLSTTVEGMPTFLSSGVGARECMRGTKYKNYSSVTSVHPEIIEGRPGTLVIESFVVDVPEGNTKDETCFFVEALIKCNLKSLANVSERLAAVQERAEPMDL